MPETAMRQTTPKKILIIEDEGDILLLLNIILSDKEIAIDNVKTLGRAMIYLDKNLPDLVMLDNRLPDGLGLDFITHIHGNYPKVKIMMISGYHSAEIKDIAIDNGADMFLEKP